MKIISLNSLACLLLGALLSAAWPAHLLGEYDADGHSDRECAVCITLPGGTQANDPPTVTLPAHPDRIHTLTPPDLILPRIAFAKDSPPRAPPLA